MFVLGKNLSKPYYQMLLKDAENNTSKQLFLAQPEFDDNYNKAAFTITHRLNKHPAFQLDTLFNLCRRLPAHLVKYRYGLIAPDADFDSSLSRHQGQISLDDAIENFQEKNIYIAIYNPEVDEQYCKIIESLLAEIALRTKEIDPYINWYSSYIFLSTRGSITPYHMDREMNFLLQITGTKTARLWSRYDDRVMSPAKRDGLLADYNLPRPEYQDSFAQRASVFNLEPGVGVHHPFIAPHLISTDSALSTSLALTYRTERSDIWTDAHRINHTLRKLHFKPRPVGIDYKTDRRKASLLGLARKVKALKPAARHCSKQSMPAKAQT